MQLYGNIIDIKNKSFGINKVEHMLNVNDFYLILNIVNISGFLWDVFDSHWFDYLQILKW